MPLEKIKTHTHTSFYKILWNISQINKEKRKPKDDNM